MKSNKFYLILVYLFIGYLSFLYIPYHLSEEKIGKEPKTTASRDERIKSNPLEDEDLKNLLTNVEEKNEKEQLNLTANEVNGTEDMIRNKKCLQHSITSSLLVIVASAIENIDKRFLIRGTWAKMAIEDGHQVLFFLNSSRRDLQENIKHEDDENHDIIQGSFDDDPSFISLIKWIHHNCRNITFVVRINDDIFPNLNLIEKYLKIYSKKSINKSHETNKLGNNSLISHPYLADYSSNELIIFTQKNIDSLINQLSETSHKTNKPIKYLESTIELKNSLFNHYYYPVNDSSDYIKYLIELKKMFKTYNFKFNVTIPESSRKFLELIRKPLIVPNIVHFILINSSKINFFMYLAIKAALKYQKPAQVMLHSDRDTFEGEFWSSLKEIKHLKIVKIEANKIFSSKTKDKWNEKAFYNFYKLVILNKYGGICVANDVLLLKKLFYERHFNFSLRVGRETSPHHLSQDVVMAVKDADIIKPILKCVMKVSNNQINLSSCLNESSVSLDADIFDLEGLSKTCSDKVWLLGKDDGSTKWKEELTHNLSITDEFVERFKPVYLMVPKTNLGKIAFEILQE